MNVLANLFLIKLFGNVNIIRQCIAPKPLNVPNITPTAVQIVL